MFNMDKILRCAQDDGIMAQDDGIMLIIADILGYDVRFVRKEEKR